jgi:hypothetical protein
LINSVVDSSALTEWAAETVADPRLLSLHQERRGRKQQPMTAESVTAFTPPTGLAGAAAEAVRVMTEGAALPLYDAVKLETEAFMRLAGSAESKQLIAAFFASRKK